MIEFQKHSWVRCLRKTKSNHSYQLDTKRSREFIFPLALNNDLLRITISWSLLVQMLGSVYIRLLPRDQDESTKLTKYGRVQQIGQLDLAMLVETPLVFLCRIPKLAFQCRISAGHLYSKSRNSLASQPSLSRNRRLNSLELMVSVLLF